MYFDNFRDYSVKIWNYKKLRMPSGKCRVLPSADVIMTTADGMHPAFSGRHPKILIISDLYWHLTEIAEVHYTPFTLTLGLLTFWLTCSIFFIRQFIISIFGHLLKTSFIMWMDLLSLQPWHWPTFIVQKTCSIFYSMSLKNTDSTDFLCPQREAFSNRTVRSSCLSVCLSVLSVC